MTYLRFLMMFLWMPCAFGVGFVQALLNWGDLDVNQATSKRYGRVVLWLAGIKLQVEGLDRLEANQPCVYVANHQGAMDIMTFGSIYPHRCAVIAKKEIFWVPFLGLFFIAAGNILIDRKKRTSAFQSLDRAVEAIRERGASVWIFAEGTRNRGTDPMLPFKKGAFHVAIAAQVPIVPVVSAPLKPVFSWEEKRVSGGTLKIKVLPPIATRGMTAADVDRLCGTVRGEMLEAFRGLSA